MSKNYELERLTFLLASMGVPDVDDLVKNATPSDLWAIGKRHAYLNPEVSKPCKLGSQNEFDAFDYDSLVKLMEDVQCGKVSCRRAAEEINNQLPTNDLLNENAELKAEIELLTETEDI